jgi:hypothetical protein
VAAAADLDAQVAEPERLELGGEVRAQRVADRDLGQLAVLPRDRARVERAACAGQQGGLDERSAVLARAASTTKNLA